jgi:uncharacterized protein (TIGR03067 family)
VEYKAVALGSDEKEATKKLNDLAAEGWEYVGPLGNSLVAFKRARLTAQQAAAKQELAKWQGAWAGDQGEKMTIKGDQWVSSTPTFGPVAGTLKNIDVQEKMTLVDLVAEEGPTKGQTCKAIFRIEGDTLHYCGTYDATRPSEFKAEGNNVYIAWKRARK